MNKPLILITICTILGLFLGVMILGNPFLDMRDRTVLGISLAGFQRSDIPLFLQILEKQWLEQPFFLQLEEEQILVDKHELGVRIDIDRTRHAIIHSRPGDIPLSLTWNEQVVDRLLHRVAGLVNRPALDARLEGSTIFHPQTGRTLNLEQTRAHLKEALGSGQDAMPIHDFSFQYPAHTIESVMRSLELPILLASYSSYLGEREQDVIYNIRKASESVNGVFLEPGTEFSFNRVVGPGEKEDGYRETMIVVNGRLVPGYGGGICQVSSTLYNALLQTGASILERHPHSGFSETTAYVAPGRDAAVSYGFKDLRFRFPDQRSAILSSIQDGYLVVELWGELENRIRRQLETRIVNFVDEGNGEGWIYVQTIALQNDTKEFEYQDRYRVCSEFALTLLAHD